MKRWTTPVDGGVEDGGEVSDNAGGGIPYVYRLGIDGLACAVGEGVAMFVSWSEVNGVAGGSGVPREN